MRFYRNIQRRSEELLQGQIDSIDGQIDAMVDALFKLTKEETRVMKGDKCWISATICPSPLPVSRPGTARKQKPTCVGWME